MLHGLSMVDNMTWEEFLQPPSEIFTVGHKTYESNILLRNDHVRSNSVLWFSRQLPSLTSAHKLVHITSEFQWSTTNRSQAMLLCKQRMWTCQIIPVMKQHFMHLTTPKSNSSIVYSMCIAPREDLIALKSEHDLIVVSKGWYNLKGLGWFNQMIEWNVYTPKY